MGFNKYTQISNPRPLLIDVMIIKITFTQKIVNVRIFTTQNSPTFQYYSNIGNFVYFIIIIWLFEQYSNIAIEYYEYYSIRNIYAMAFPHFRPVDAPRLFSAEDDWRA